VSRGGLAAVAAAAVLVLFSLFLVRDHTRDDSLSADEPVHILSGWFGVHGRTAIVNIEHPPVAKVLAGLALGPLPIPRPPSEVPMGTTFTDYGHAFLFENVVSPDRIVAAARAPFLGVLAVLLVLVFAAARSRYGAVAGLFALALVALDPTFVAHAGVVHTDVGAAAGFLGPVLAWEAARRRPTPLRVALAGVALGLALATKFSAILLVPILVLQSLFAARREAKPGRAVASSVGRLAAAGVVALLVILAVYAPLTSRMNPDHQRQVIRQMVAGRGAPRLSAAIESLVPFSRPLAHYAGGLASVIRQSSVGGGVNFLKGRTSVEGFPLYFFVAFALKSTLAFLAVTGLVVAAFLRRPRSYSEEARLFLLPVAVLFLASIGSAYNIGIRHMLPVYPFLALAGAAVLAQVAAGASRGGKWKVAAAALALLPALSAGEVLRIHPHELSYFNALAGGSERGRESLSDSNVDWGLDLKRLAAELERRGVRDPTVVYFGGDDVPARIGVPDFAAEPFVRGKFVAISAFQLAVGPEFHEYHGEHEIAAALRKLESEISKRGRPAGRVGYSMYLFELPDVFPLSTRAERRIPRTFGPRDDIGEKVAR
jgi:4-amino-4-deoxy-L-arabinose transferase-like glycosyltransferase